MEDRIIETQILYSYITTEPYLLLGLLIVFTWLFYKFFLQTVSEERHRNIKGHFNVLIKNYFVLSILFLSYLFLHESGDSIGQIIRLKPYAALFTYIWGVIVFVKTSRLLVLQYLFMGSMRSGVPLLLVNIFSLLLLVIIMFWSVSRVFGVQLGPLLATSAAFSIVLGLALQDTLGNLFAGISLQIDKSYEIDDWVEITMGVQKIVGQVKEISWRSTTLLGLSDEVITLPNKTMAQAQISNFSPPDNPIVRSQIFRIQLGTSVDSVKQVLEESVNGLADIRPIPAPFAYMSEVNEHFMAVKLVYFIDNYGQQHLVADKVLSQAHQALAENKIPLARNYLELKQL